MIYLTEAQTLSAVSQIIERSGPISGDDLDTAVEQLDSMCMEHSLFQLWLDRHVTLGFENGELLWSTDRTDGPR